MTDRLGEGEGCLPVVIFPLCLLPLVLAADLVLELLQVVLARAQLGEVVHQPELRQWECLETLKLRWILSPDSVDIIDISIIYTSGQQWRETL